MSQSHLVHITLEQLIKASEHIVVVEKDSLHEQGKRYRFVTGDGCEGMNMRDAIKRRPGTDAGT